MASQFGMDLTTINFLGNQPNPTATLLIEKNPTLAQLRHHLLSDEMEREDVVKVIAEWVERHCECEDCASGIR